MDILRIQDVTLKFVHIVMVPLKFSILINAPDTHSDKPFCIKAVRERERERERVRERER